MKTFRQVPLIFLEPSRGHQQHEYGKIQNWSTRCLKLGWSICTIHQTCLNMILKTHWIWEQIVTVVFNTNFFRKSHFKRFSSDRFVAILQKLAIESRFCRKILIWRALEIPDLEASNNGSNVETQHFGADIAAFEVVGNPQSRISANRSEIKTPFLLRFSQKIVLRWTLLKTEVAGFSQILYFSTSLFFGCMLRMSRICGNQAISKVSTPALKSEWKVKSRNTIP